MVIEYSTLYLSSHGVPRGILRWIGKTPVAQPTMNENTRQGCAFKARPRCF